MRTWPGLGAVGAGLIHLGSAAGAPLPTQLPLVLVGVTELVWGVVALSREVPPAPRAAAAFAGAVLLLTVVALLLPPSAARHGAHVDLGVPPGAFGGAGALVLAVAALIAARLGGLRTGGAESHPVRFLAAAAGAAALVAVVVIRSLAATSSGGTMQMH